MNGYTCVVCVKQVPDTKKVTGQAMKADGTINRAALPAIFNPEDKNALEAALSVKERYGGKVIAIAMGLPAATAVLREALACGADEAVLVTDRKAAGSDTLATSYILSQAVKKFKPDLVFCGRQAIDGDTAQTGPQIGEKLDCAVVTYLEKLDQDLFNMLTGVSGVGPKVALAIMGTVKSDTLISAIATGDAKTIATAPGVGKKMAEKIIVELKSKVGGVSATLFAPDTSTNSASALPDLLLALESLGYRRLDIIEMAQRLVNENPTADVSTLVPIALKEISKGK